MNTVAQTDTALRTRALESLLIEKGLLTTEIIDEIVEKYEKDVGPLNGAKVVARAWTDPDYKRRLLKDGRAAIAELGFGSAQGAKIVVLENSPSVHHLVVCTLCSCYPWSMLGLPPNWYKSYAYRSRVVREPRAVLREFDLDLPDSRRNPRLGQQLGPPLHGPARTPCWHRRLHRRTACPTCHARLDDRRGPDRIALKVRIG